MLPQYFRLSLHLHLSLFSIERDEIRCSSIAERVHIAARPSSPCSVAGNGNTELWLVYHQTSRTSKPATVQLIDLELSHPLTDLEDVLDHIFQKGFVDAKYRPVTWLEQHDGASVKATQSVQDLLKLGAGKSPETALRLVIGECPMALPCY